MMTSSQQQALVSLLQDEDAATVGLIKGQLIESGEAQLQEYRQLLLKVAGPAQENLRQIINEIEASHTLGAISRGLAGLKSFGQLEELCWQLARPEHPGFDGGPYSRQLDEWAEEAARLLTPNATSLEKIHCLTRYLGVEKGLTGNSRDYYHPRNACLPWTIEFRSGLPITLSLIYILIGYRLKIPVEGVAAPGHFLTRLDGIIFDPYYRGRILSEGEWELMMAEVPVPERAYVSRAATPLQIMHRLLINLRNCHVKRNDAKGRSTVDSYLAVLQR